MEKLLAQTRKFKEGTEVGPIPGVPGSEEVATLKGLEAIFSNIISVALALAGIVLFVMFLVGGFRYLTSGGDPKALEAAKGTLTHAIAGLAILVFAVIILQLIKEITGVDITTFQITRP